MGGEQISQILLPAFGEVYAAYPGFPPGGVGPIVFDDGFFGELDPHGNVIEAGEGHVWLKVGPQGAGLYEVHLSGTFETSTGMPTPATLRLSLNGAQDCKISFFGYGGAASGFIRLAAGDVVAAEFQISPLYEDVDKIVNFHLTIRRIAP